MDTEAKFIRNLLWAVGGLVAWTSLSGALVMLAIDPVEHQLHIIGTGALGAAAVWFVFRARHYAEKWTGQGTADVA